MAQTEIYYFSGSGNSLYVAKTLQKMLPGSSLFPIVRLFTQKEVKLSPPSVGFVFPIHLSTIPIFILDYIKTMDLSTTEYVFAIATRIGTQHSAFSQLKKVIAAKGKKLNSAISLNMPSNDPKFGFKAFSNEEINNQKLIINNKLLELASLINTKKDFLEEDTSFLTKIPFVNSIAWLVKLTDNIQQKFYTDKKCIGCGTCAQACPSGKIIMKGDRPFWQKEIKCFKCNACLNFCPKQAVQIKGFTEGKDRYNHPYATVEDIAQQKKN